MNPSAIYSLLVLTAFLFWGGYGIRYNASESLPYRIYLSSPAKKLQIGQIVTFTLPESPVTFAKEIGGIPGDHIEVKDHMIYINGRERGKILEKYEPIHGGSIPEGFYCMLGEHEKSFDSRYLEFGLVPEEYIKESLCPIF